MSWNNLTPYDVARMSPADKLIDEILYLEKIRGNFPYAPRVARMLKKAIKGLRNLSEFRVGDDKADADRLLAELDAMAEDGR